MKTEILQVDGRWHWRLSNDDGTRRASSEVFVGYDTELEAQAAGADAAKRAAYEVYESESGWRWRRVDENGTEVAISEPYPDQHAAAEAVEALVAR